MGLDDSVALFLYLYAQMLGLIKIVGIFCGHGNTDLDNVVRNVVRILVVANRTDVSN